MFFHIHPSNGVPVYEQIARQIMFAVASGGIVPGELVPSVRNLSRELAVNPNTVARAYLELELAGVIETKKGSGAFVSDEGSPLARKQKNKILQERIDALLAEAKHLDISVEAVIKMIEQRSK